MSVIEWAENHLFGSKDDHDIMYWRAYLDGARAQKREIENRDAPGALVPGSGGPNHD